MKSKLPPVQLGPEQPPMEYDVLQFILAARGYAEALSQRLDEVQRLTPSWPVYMYEQVSDISLSPPDPIAQAALDLGTYIGNMNLRLDALIERLNTPSS